MPISLLLQEFTAAFRYGARVLDPWNHLVQIEELLIDRARSAFLFKWFGESLPLQGFHLRVAIANIGELRERYAKVKDEVQLRAQGPNLTEPAFGIAGVAVGMLLTPGVAIGSAIAIVRSLKWHATTFWQVLGEIWRRVLIVVASLFAPVVAGLSPLLAVGGFAGYLQMGLANDPGLRGIYELLGGLARLLDAAANFIKLLLGPRSEVKNSVLSILLGLFDQLAKAVPFGLAFIAELVTRFGPLLIPIEASITAFYKLVVMIVDTLAFILNSLIDEFKAVFSGPNNIVSPIKFVLERLSSAFSRLVPTFNSLLQKATAMLEDSFTNVQKQVKEWGGSLGTNLRELINKHPILIKKDRLIDALKLAGIMLSRDSTKAKRDSPSVFDPWSQQAKKWAADAERTLESAPTFPQFETPGEMIDRLGLEAKYGIPKDQKAMEKYTAWVKSGLPPMNQAVTKYVERARHPVSVFAYENSQLGGAKTPKEALKKAHAEELELRNTIVTMVASVLPSNMLDWMTPLLNTFELFDQTISLEKNANKPEAKSENTGPAKLPFPVKDLPLDNGLLQPVVQQLLIRSKSGRSEDLREFAKLLQLKFDEQMQQKLYRPNPA